MITAILAILVGLVLLVGRLGAVPGIGPGLEKLARWLLPFEVVIGVVALVVGILEFVSLEGILLILAGLVLAISALRSIPSVGPWLARAGAALEPYRVIIGVILLVVGVLDLAMILLGGLGRGRP